MAAKIVRISRSLAASSASRAERARFAARSSISATTVDARSSKSATSPADHARAAPSRAQSIPTTCPAAVRSGTPQYAPTPSSVTAGWCFQRSSRRASSITSGASVRTPYEHSECDSGSSRDSATGAGSAQPAAKTCRRASTRLTAAVGTPSNRAACATNRWSAEFTGSSE